MGILVAGLFEIAAYSLKNIPPQRHPMDVLVSRIDTNVMNAEAVIMGDSVTKSVVDWYDIGPSIANLTDNRSSGVIGMMFVLVRYLSSNLPPRLIYISTTPESLSYVPENSFDYFIGSVFKGPSERSWLNRHSPGYAQPKWNLAVFDAKQRVFQPTFGMLRRLTKIEPATDGHHNLDVITNLESMLGRYVSLNELRSRLEQNLVPGETATQAIAALCRKTSQTNIKLVFAWAPTPESVYQYWRHESQLNDLQNLIINMHDGACSDVTFHDFNSKQNYPDYAFLDPEHLRRPGWAALYGRQLRKQILEAMTQ